MCWMGRMMVTWLVKVKNPVDRRVINALRTKHFERVGVITTRFNDFRFYSVF